MTREPQFNPRIVLAITLTSFQEFDHGGLGNAFIERSEFEEDAVPGGSKSWQELQPGDTCKYEVGDNIRGTAKVVSVGPENGADTLFKVEKVS
jgi:hypothetical protein